MARRRRKVLLDTTNHERWLVSYADFITLLFAFFVVMYSISSVNEGKYRSLTESLGTAFSNSSSENKTPQPNAVEGTPNVVAVPEATAQLTPPPEPEPPAPEEEKKRELSEEIMAERKQLHEASEKLENVLKPMVDKGLISVKRNDYWVELEMNSELLYLSGEATLTKKSKTLLKEIAAVISLLPNAVHIEGHTDNVPIKNIKYPSNWELSAARASSVVQELANEGVNPKRLSAIGYGEFQPLGENTNLEGRFKNRRVTMVLMSQAFARYGANDAERAKLLNLAPTNGNAPAAPTQP
jgi:chemotaxis protein MotB